MDVPLYLYPVLWLLAFGLGFGILLALSRDPYFNPHKGWMALISIAGGFQLSTSVFAGITTYNFLKYAMVLSFAYTAVGALAVFVIVSLVWIWFNIQAFV